MEAQGKIIAVLEANSGVSKSSGREWKSQEYVMEVPGQYPRKICFRIFGEDRINEAHIQLGEDLTVFFDIDAHEWNGRWFNSINAYRVSRMGDAMPEAYPSNAPFTQPMAQQPVSVAPQAAPFNGVPASSEADDLPF